MPLITEIQVKLMYKRFRETKVMTGTSMLSDLEIFRLVCEEDERTPYDMEWWNTEYHSLYHAALDVKTQWNIHQNCKQNATESALAGLDPDFDK